MWIDIDQVSNDGGILIKVEGVSRADERKDETLFLQEEGAWLDRERVRGLERNPPLCFACKN